jgi:pimeloyl-ACP methyl ester carboxylesterase
MVMVPGNPAALIKMADPRRYLDPDYMAKHFKTLYGGMVGNKAEHINRLRPPSKTGYFYQLLAMAGWTSAPFLPFLNTQTLIMMGGDDQIVPLANGKILDFLIPNSELFVIPDGGHLFLLSHAEESIAAIRGFLDDSAAENRKAA